MTVYQTIGLLLTAYVALANGQPRKIWTIALGSEWGGHEYIDPEGYLKGYGIDIITRVCQHGGMDCRIVRDKYTSCWQSDPAVHPSPGRGLMARWYDGCTGWVPTLERIHSLSFTNPYLQEIDSFFYFLKGNSFDDSNLSGKTIGFLEGWATNEKCLARQTNIRNSKLTEDQIVFVPYPQDAIDGLKDSKFLAVFGTENNWTPDQRDQLDRKRNAIKCFLGGNGIMARKDSALIAAWNVGFSKLKDTNGYSKFCDKYKEQHKSKGEVQCNVA